MKELWLALNVRGSLRLVASLNYMWILTVLLHAYCIPVDFTDNALHFVSVWEMFQLVRFIATVEKHHLEKTMFKLKCITAFIGSCL